MYAPEAQPEVVVDEASQPPYVLHTHSDSPAGRTVRDWPLGHKGTHRPSESRLEEDRSQKSEERFPGADDANAGHIVTLLFDKVSDDTEYSKSPDT